MYHILGIIYPKLSNPNIYMTELIIKVTLENVCKSLNQELIFLCSELYY